MANWPWDVRLEWFLQVIFEKFKDHLKIIVAVLSIMLYIDEDYKVKMAETARKTTQEQIQKGEEGKLPS